ncbi:MAG: PQQ-like beta-propeller repeat protein [Planctomycetes bacterium]|nr:PQQ-like beta-propeller repeat protein [Planctomycetota bacterium]
MPTAATRQLSIVLRALAAASLLVLVSTPAGAQPLRRMIEVEPDRPGQPPDGRLFATDRQMARQLRDAATLLEDGHYAAAIARLQHLLDGDEDAFYQPEAEDGSRYVSLKAEAQRFIGRLPEEGRRQYETQYGGIARALLDEALAEDSVAKLQEVSRRFFHTPAGAEALYLLGTWHLDRSEPLAAALRLDRLRRERPPHSPPYQGGARGGVGKGTGLAEPLLSLRTAVAWQRAGMPEKAAEVLIELKRSHSVQPLTIAGRRVEFFTEDADASGWLATITGKASEPAAPPELRWTMFRGNPSRTASAAPAAPVWQTSWEASLIPGPADLHGPPTRYTDAEAERVRAEVKALQQRHREAGDFLTIPAGMPLVVGDTVLVRTPADVRAVSAKSGETLWTVINDDASFREVILKDLNIVPPQNHFGMEQEPAREALLNQRAWRDLTSGTLSSDGRNVYAVEDTGFLGPYTTTGRQGPQHLAPKPANNLAAYDLGSGYFRWIVGGESGNGPELPLAGTFFLGPPMVLGKQLYCLAETAGEIRLIVLEEDTQGPRSRFGLVSATPTRSASEGGRHAAPAVVWEQRLLYPSESLVRNPLRRMAGLSPAYDDGVLVCPTMAGAVVAVDLSTRTLLWGYRYSTPKPDPVNNRQAMMVAQLRQRYGGVDFDDEDRWVDSVPLIADGRVILTPRDSGELHCLNLVDGSPAWIRPRGQGLYVAAAGEGRVVIVGRSQVEAVRLDDGQPAWKQPVPVAMPSGRGVRCGDAYHLPTEAGELVTIRLSDGRLLARSKSSDGRVAGNLVAAGGRIISQSALEISAFEDRESLHRRIAETLANDADDPSALALRGELRLHEGDDRGLDDLRSSLAHSDSPRTRAVMAEALLEGLRRDFARYRRHTAEIDRLLSDDEQRARYLRLMAEGLEQIGDREAAFAEYMKLTAQSGDLPLLTVDGSLQVRADRWVRPRLWSLYHDAAPATRPQMEQSVRERLNAAVGDNSPEALVNFLRWFADFPAADEARRALAERIDAAREPLALELVLGRLRESDDEHTAAEATARLARLWIDRHREREAMPLLAELEAKWPDLIALEGLTGRELAARWKQEPAVLDALAAAAPWPERELVPSAENRNRFATPTLANVPVEFVGRRGPWRGWQFSVDQRHQYLTARESGGDTEWKIVNTGLDPSRSLTIVNAPQKSSVLGRGHLLAATIGHDVFVLDGLTVGTPETLWNRRLDDSPPVPDSPRLARNVIIMGAVPGGRLTDSKGRPLGQLGAVTDEAIIYQVGTTLFAAEPLTGTILWQRANVPRGSDIVGDREVLLVAAPDSNHAQVLSAVNGAELGTRLLPPAADRVQTFGRRIVAWETFDGRRRLALIDPLDGSTAWQQPFAANSHISLLDDAEAAVVEPDGRLTLMSLDDGRRLTEARLSPDDIGADLHVVSGGGRLLVLSYDARRAPAAALGGAIVRPVGGGPGRPLVNGPVVALDRRTGKMLWRSELAQPMWLHLAQPFDLPVLVLSVQMYQQAQQRGRALFNRNHSEALVLDTRTGKVVHKASGAESTLMFFQVFANRDQERITVAFPRDQLVLSPTGPPLR